MVVDRIKHTKPPAKRTFLDELEPIPYTISNEEVAEMPPRMREILFGSADIPEGHTPVTSPPEDIGNSLSDLPYLPAPYLNLLIPQDATNNQLDQLKIQAPANQEFEIERAKWHISRFAKQDADQLLKIFEALQDDQEMTIIVSRKNEDSGENLWEQIAHLYQDLQSKE